MKKIWKGFSQLKLVRIYHSSCFWLKIVIAINVNRICSRKTGSNLKKFLKAFFINDFSGKMLGKFEEKSPKHKEIFLLNASSIRALENLNLLEILSCLFLLWKHNWKCCPVNIFRHHQKEGKIFAVRKWYI